MNKQNVYLSLLCISVLAFSLVPFMHGIDSESKTFFFLGGVMCAIASAYLLIVDSNKPIN